MQGLTGISESNHLCGEPVLTVTSTASAVCPGTSDDLCLHWSIAAYTQAPQPRTSHHLEELGEDVTVGSSALHSFPHLIQMEWSATPTSWVGCESSSSVYTGSTGIKCRLPMCKAQGTITEVMNPWIQKTTDKVFVHSEQVDFRCCILCSYSILVQIDRLALWQNCET